MPRNSSILALSEQLLRCGDDVLLDTPLDALRDRVEDDEARELFRDLYESGEASSLRELLAPSSFERWAFEVATPREGQIVRAALRRMLGVGHFGDDDPERLVVVEALPEDVDGLVAWAKRYGIPGALSMPAGEAMLDPVILGEGTTLLECALGLFEAPRGASALTRDRAREQARSYLVREAAAQSVAAARKALFASPLRSESLAPLAERLRACIGKTSFTELHSARFVPARLVTVDETLGVAKGVMRGADDAAVHVRLLLGGYEQRAITSDCDTCRAQPCIHARALAARLLDACHAGRDRLAPAIDAFTSEPSWRAFLNALVPTATPQASGTSRLAFRVRVTGEQVAVAAVQRRAATRGRAAHGKLLTPAAARRTALAAREDEPVLEAMLLGHRVQTAMYAPASLLVLRALTEHAHVELDGANEPLTVREEAVEILLTEHADGVLPSVRLGGRALSAGDRGRDATYVAVLDRATASLVFAPLTPALSRFLSGLATFRGVLPPASYNELAPHLAALGKVAHVAVPKALEGRERPTPEKLLLRITPALDEGVDIALSMRPFPLSPLFSPGHGPELVQGLEDGQQVFVRRDLAKERETAKRVIDLLSLTSHYRLEPFAYHVDSTQGALEVLSRAARLEEVLLEWGERGRTLSVASTIKASDLKVDLFKKGDWWQLSGGARADSVDVGLARLFEAVRRNERFVPLSGGSHAEIERELFERLSVAQLCVNEGKADLTVPQAAVPFLVGALGERGEGRDETARAMLAVMRPHPIARVPSALAPLLRPYQRDGLDFLVDRSRFATGACLADEMGLGKTVQAIALLVERAPLGPALVVAPTSVCDGWVQEISRFAPGLTPRAYRGAERAKQLADLRAWDVVVTSYDLLLRDETRFAAHRFATEIIDEAQVVKNARTQKARAVAAMQAGFRVALTGTPIENRLGDLWSLFHLIAPDLLGSWNRFRSRFAVPIERFERTDRAEALRQLVAPFILRRTKSEVLPHLPSRTELVKYVELSPPEQDLYDAAVREAKKVLGKRKKQETTRTVRILAELTRLRQLACHPRLVFDDARLESSKLHALMELLTDVLPRGHRALVFSQFTQHLALLREALEARSLPYLYLDGATPAEARAERVARFQAGEGQLFLISLRAGGTGLNLTGADYVVHMDPWWNPKAEDQASDRAHRLGQDKPVTIVKLVTENTIEEKVIALHEHKRRLADAVLEETGLTAELDEATLEALLREA